MHNHGGKDDTWMMWAMMICCAIPLLAIVLFGLGGKALGAPTWIVIGGVALMVIAHFVMMGRSGKEADKEDALVEGKDGKQEGSSKKDHSGHGCH